MQLILYFFGVVGGDKEQITNNLRKSTRQVVTCAIVKNNMDKGVMGVILCEVCRQGISEEETLSRDPKKEDI